MRARMLLPFTFSIHSSETVARAFAASSVSALTPFPSLDLASPCGRYLFRRKAELIYDACHSESLRSLEFSLVVIISLIAAPGVVYGLGLFQFMIPGAMPSRA